MSKYHSDLPVLTAYRESGPLDLCITGIETEYGLGTAIHAVNCSPGTDRLIDPLYLVLYLRGSLNDQVPGDLRWLAHQRWYFPQRREEPSPAYRLLREAGKLTPGLFYDSVNFALAEKMGIGIRTLKLNGGDQR